MYATGLGGMALPVSFGLLGEDSREARTDVSMWMEMDFWS